MKPLRPRKPRLRIAKILAWADAHYRRFGRWPTSNSGQVIDAPTEAWARIDEALRRGHRGLKAGSSLIRLLAEKRGIRTPRCLPRLTHAQVLAWADAHFARTGRWPFTLSGPIPEAPGETWSAVDWALRSGKRGLRGCYSLFRFLIEHRGKGVASRRRCLSLREVLTWAEAQARRTGSWPWEKSGPVLEHPDLNWKAINIALYQGFRGLPGGTTLARLLRRHRNLLLRRPAGLLGLLGGEGQATQAASSTPKARSRAAKRDRHCE